jgi:hypothetical protein
MAAGRCGADDGDLPMKEAPMNILTRLFRLPPAAPARRVGRAAAIYDELELQLEPEPEEEAPRGCGWFDSSHELQCGLWVHEHDSPDDLAGELPLGPWIELHLAGWQPQAPG